MQMRFGSAYTSLMAHIDVLIKRLYDIENNFMSVVRLIVLSSRVPIVVQIVLKCGAFRCPPHRALKARYLYDNTIYDSKVYLIFNFSGVSFRSRSST